jgi:GNAT superfamily N-acetyltransferase
MTYERPSGEFLVTTDTARLDIDAIHDYLSREAYWCQGIPRETVERAIENSVNFGLLHGARQVGFTRVVTDKATYAWVCDVYVLPEYRGRGLARLMLETMLEHPELQGLRRWTLATRDAHDLYRRVGFAELPNPERWMIIVNPDVYSQNVPARQSK